MFIHKGSHLVELRLLQDGEPVESVGYLVSWRYLGHLCNRLVNQRMLAFNQGIVVSKEMLQLRNTRDPLELSSLLRDSRGSSLCSLVGRRKWVASISLVEVVLSLISIIHFVIEIITIAILKSSIKHGQRSDILVYSFHKIPQLLKIPLELDNQLSTSLLERQSKQLFSYAFEVVSHGVEGS